MTDDDRIPFQIAGAPLSVGDDISLQVDVDMWPHALNGSPGDVVVLVVPPGRGLLVEAWLRRQIFEGPADKQARLEADTIAELAA